RQAPAFALVGPRLGLLERLHVVDEADLGPPRDLDDRALPVGDPFAEAFLAEGLHLQRLSGLGLDPAKPRSPVEPGAFVEDAVPEDESLREGGAIVRIRTDDLIAPRRRGSGRRRVRRRAPLR